jgi:hypothetical protein
VSTTARAETRDESLRAFLHRVSGRHAMSQLTAISEAAYHQGLTRVRARLEAANGADLLIASPMTFITVVGDKP